MIDAQLCQEISRFGNKTVSSGLTSSRFGNISVIRGNAIIITKTGSMLDELDQNHLVEVDLEGPCPLDELASTETCVHRAIYQSTSALAVIHTHSPFAVALSLIEENVIEPIESEGLHFMGPMHVVEAGFGSQELATEVSKILGSSQVCIAKGHGVFARGQSLAEAYTMACMAEHSSKVRYLVKIFQMCQLNLNA
jgi:L-fuculose-phosphate aldolase